MPYRRNQKKFSRERKTRNALVRGLVENLIVYGRIRTTHARAKAVRPAVEDFLQKAKTNNVATIRLLRKNLTENTVKKLLIELGPRYQNRAGGYTRITKTLARQRDGAAMAVIEFVQ